MEVETDQDITDLTKFTPKGIPMELILEYDSKGLTSTEIAKILDCDSSNIRQRLIAHKPDIDCLPSYKGHRADIIALKGREIINNITSAKLEKASAYQLTGMYSLMNQAERLERDLSTQNIATIHSDIEAIRKETKELPDDTA